MKVSYDQLSKVMENVKKYLVGYDNRPVTLEISIVQENPGEGMLAECVKIVATRDDQKSSENQIKVDIEVYDKSTGADSVMVKEETIVIK